MPAGPRNIYSDEGFVCACATLQQLFCSLEFEIKKSALLMLNAVLINIMQPWIHEKKITQRQNY